MSQPVSNIAEYTVTEISVALRRTVEDNFERVRVRGEISNFKGAHGSGHCYFRLKDDRACLEAVVWKTTMQRLRFKPQEGLEMVATGKLTTYPARSGYQLVIDHLEPAGAGALMALLEERRRKLQAERLFDTARKKPIPHLPVVIGVVTSPSGAVIRDILHRLRDRFPSHVLVWPVRVQGDGAAEEVAAAVRGFNAIAPGGPIPRPDVLIVARGGGSIEDLWAFNEEIAVRAVAESRIPTIAAVGHETDWTLIDHAADLRAPTPTGAAEMAVPVRAELSAAVRSLASRHELGLSRGMEARRRDLAGTARALPGLGDLLALPRQKLDHAGERLGLSMAGRLDRPRQRLAEAAGRLGRSLVAEVAGKRREYASIEARLTPGLLARGQQRSRERLSAVDARLAHAGAARLRLLRQSMEAMTARLDVSKLARVVDRHSERFTVACRMYQSLKDTASPQAILSRGYALVRTSAGVTVRAPDDVTPGDALAITLGVGEIGAIVTDGEAVEGLGSRLAAVFSRPVPKRRPRSRQPAPGQGSLF